MTDPDSLRALLRERRRSLGGEERIAAESAIRGHLTDLLRTRTTPGPGAPVDRRHGTVALFLPTDGEPDLEPSVAGLRATGWFPHLPVVGPGRSMAFAPWQPGAELRPNRFGVAEPVVPAGALVGAERMDVVVVPCVGLDREGHRVGFGAGFYDRALAGLPVGRPLVVGVAFEVQVVDEVPVRPWDVPVDVVLTEAGVHRVRR